MMIFFLLEGEWEYFLPSMSMGVFLPSRSMGAKFLPGRSMGVGEGDDGLPPLDNGPGLPDHQNHQRQIPNTQIQIMNMPFHTYKITKHKNPSNKYAM